ncbi:hypothetical protein [Mesorhizobium sp. WSM4313]|uniref:hypothetical protein n=1 Tax=Mesorhizobium sp. WSM4313 TaxID=2029412 RepID=UPI001140A612|nr:hypothetical protein [Mesorhizobium sp. WSM4313]
MGIQRFSHFAPNSMKIAGGGIKTSLTTETEAFFDRVYLQSAAWRKSLQPSVAAPLSFWRRLD